MGTQVIFSCERTYRDLQGTLSLWHGYDECLTLISSVQGGLNGCRGSIDVVASDKEASEFFKEISGFPPDISSPVSDTLTVALTVGARQRLKVFGRNNARLSGKMVSNSGDVRVVELGQEILVPMNPNFQPAIRRKKSGPG